MGGGMGIKGSDLHAIPLCRLHHSEYHHFGKETFWGRHNMDKWQVVAQTLEGYVCSIVGQKKGITPKTTIKKNGGSK